MLKATTLECLFHPSVTNEVTSRKLMRWPRGLRRRRLLCCSQVKGVKMRDYTRITVDLSKDEFVALREAASKEYRHPREQARWLLRQLLVQGNGNAQSQPSTNSEEMTLAL